MGFNYIHYWVIIILIEIKAVIMSSLIAEKPAMVILSLMTLHKVPAPFIGTP